MALVHQVIDFIDDTDKSILKLATEGAPRHIRTGEVFSAEERELLPETQFALVMRTKEAQVLKKFPLTDETNTWLSCRYFEKTSEQLPYVAQKVAASNLRRACLVFGLPVTNQIEKLASTEIVSNKYDEVKSMKEDQGHANSVQVSQVSPDGSAHFYALSGRYPMPDGAYVKKAAQYFVEHHREFTDVEDRATFAANVLSRANELGVGLDKTASDTLGTYAGTSYGDSVQGQIRLRQSLLEHKPEMAKALDKLASKIGETDPGTFSKALHLFDKKAGISKHHGSYIADPYKATFATMKKTSSYRWEDLQSGVSIDGAELSKAAEDSYDKIKSYFGPTLADSLKKHPEQIFESLPVDAKTTLAKIAKGTI